MSKERLEEIKKEYKKDMYDCKLGRFDIYWLIEQAERFEAYVKETAKVHEQNKRYREAMIEAINEICCGIRLDEHEIEAIDILDEALEETE